MAHYTVGDVITSAREILKDVQVAKWTENYMLVIVRHGVTLIRRELGMQNPDTIVSEQIINTVNGTKWYDLPADFLWDISIGRGAGYNNITKRSANEYMTEDVGEPNEYMIKNFYDDDVVSYTKIGFQKTPDQAYAYILRYVPYGTTITQSSDAIPLPNFCRELVEQWVVKMALARDEYETFDEKEQLMFVRNLIGGVNILRGNEINVELE